ncbi:MAG: hypothetical protein AAGJ83_07855, partial [Planctomycetota bacterium]
ECCTKCGSTSCCSEKVTKRLSEIAYERDDTGCCLEPNAEIRAAAAKALCVCCPNRATGPIEEDIPALEEVPPPSIPGEGGEKDSKTIPGEGGQEELDRESEDGVENAIQDLRAVESVEGSAVQMMVPQPLLLHSANQPYPTEESVPQVEVPEIAELPTPEPEEAPVKPRGDVHLGQVKVIGGMTIQPVTISTVSATDEQSVQTKVETEQATAISASLPSLPAPELELPEPVALPIDVSAKPVSDGSLKDIGDATTHITVPADAQVTGRRPGVKATKTEARIVGVDYRTGRVSLRSGQPLRPGSSVTVYHRYLTGERLIAHLLIKQVDGAQAVAVATDKSGLSKIAAGDRAVCH